MTANTESVEYETTLGVAAGCPVRLTAGNLVPLPASDL